MGFLNRNERKTERQVNGGMGVTLPEGLVDIPLNGLDEFVENNVYVFYSSLLDHFISTTSGVNDLFTDLYYYNSTSTLTNDNQTRLNLKEAIIQTILKQNVEYYELVDNSYLVCLSSTDYDSNNTNHIYINFNNFREITLLKDLYEMLRLGLQKLATDQVVANKPVLYTNVSSTDYDSNNTNHNHINYYHLYNQTPLLVV